jgi:hypothetical protein
VDRYTITVPDNASQSTIVRKAKRVAGWNGFIRTTTEDYGDTYRVNPVGRRKPCIVMFISYKESSC